MGWIGLTNLLVFHFRVNPGTTLSRHSIRAYSVHWEHIVLAHALRKIRWVWCASDDKNLRGWYRKTTLVTTSMFYAGQPACFGMVFKPRHLWTWLLTQKTKKKNTAAYTSEVLAGVACRIDTVSSVLTQKEENKRRQTKYILKPQPTWKGLFLSVFSCSVLLREQDDNDDARNGTVGVCVYVCGTFSLFHLDALAADSMRSAMCFATLWIAGSPPSRLHRKHIKKWRTDSDRVGAFLGVTSATSRGGTSATSRQRWCHSTHQPWDIASRLHAYMPAALFVHQVQAPPWPARAARQG